MTMCMDISTTTSAVLVLLSGILCAALLFCYWWYWPEGGAPARDGGHLSPPQLPLAPFSRNKGGGVHECAVCLTEFEEGEKVKAIPGCGHVFHPPCIDRWLISNCSCPLCRCSEIPPCSKV